MSFWLKQSTAVTVKLGPFVDSGDGNTVEDGLTIQKADVRLSKNGGDIAAANADQGASDAGAAHDEIGYYDISLNTTDTNTVGRLKIMVHESGALPVWADYMVVPSLVYDQLFASGADLKTTVNDARSVADSFDTGMTIAEGARKTLALAGGESTGAGTSQKAFKGIDGTTVEVVVDTDDDGNRTSVDYNP